MSALRIVNRALRSHSVWMICVTNACCKFEVEPKLVMSPYLYGDCKYVPSRLRTSQKALKMNSVWPKFLMNVYGGCECVTHGLGIVSKALGRHSVWIKCILSVCLSVYQIKM